MLIDRLLFSVDESFSANRSVLCRILLCRCDVVSVIACLLVLLWLCGSRSNRHCVWLMYTKVIEGFSDREEEGVTSGVEVMVCGTLRFHG